VTGGGDGPAVERAAVVATGVIGASWATVFLARGLHVTATDPAPGAEDALRRTVEAQWPAMEAMGGIAPGAAPDRRLRFVPSPAEAVADAEFVQENGPERLDLKRDLFRLLDEAAPAEAILSTSSSTITVSEIQDACARHPGRVVLGHPFNPPHLVPLVEVAGGGATSAEAVERAMAFYRALGKHPIHLRREVRGHVANRLQAALWQEAFHLVAAGVASVEDVDAAIAHGPGLRWALLGPFLNLHLSGGAGGIGELFGKPLWQATEGMWRDLGTVSVDAELGRKVVDGVAEELAALGGREHVTRRRDAALLALLRVKADAPR
jgi:carnitine 3-dehydrogenase